MFPYSGSNFEFQSESFYELFLMLSLKKTKFRHQLNPDVNTCFNTTIFVNFNFCRHKNSTKFLSYKFSLKTIFGEISICY